MSRADEEGGAGSDCMEPPQQDRVSDCPKRRKNLADYGGQKTSKIEEGGKGAQQLDKGSPPRSRSHSFTLGRTVLLGTEYCGAMSQRRQDEGVAGVHSVRVKREGNLIKGSGPLGNYVKQEKPLCTRL